MVGWFVEKQKVRFLCQQPGQVCSHDPAPAHGAGRPVKILLPETQAGQDLFGFGLEPIAAELIEPIMHIIVMQKSVLDENPWAARNLFNAFVESKRRSLERLLDPAVSRYPLPWLPAYARRMSEMFDGDPFPYGIEENRPTFEQFLRYAHEQGIAKRHAKPDEIFPKGIMTSVRI